MTVRAAAAARQTLTAGFWTLQALLLFVAAAWLAWHCLAAVNFGYPVWHDALGIDTTIERYAPRNRYREDFAQTTPAERARLFGAIVDAIHDDGRGLAGLRYYASDGRVLGRLLRPPEIVHLRDVARLVNGFQMTGAAALVLFLGGAVYARATRRTLPTWHRFAVGAGVLLAATGMVLLVAGPVRVFYGLHEWVFPPDHPWFFWYEDSLMSTMMQAPDLFGAIAVAWGLLTALFVVPGYLLLQRWLAVGQRGRAV